MSKTYRAIVLKGMGGLEQLELRELPLLEPGPRQVRIKVTASGAGFTDITMRTGYYPFRPPFPFVQGYEVVGVIDAVGAEVRELSVGQRVCGLTVHGGWGEYLVREEDEFVPVPDGLDDAEVVALVLNYVTAYQAIHRAAKLPPGASALVTGANGGVGVALLELLRDHGASSIGSASRAHAATVESYGARPIESRARPLDEQVRELLPDGVDAAFDGLGGSGTRACVRATRRGGVVVSYGFMAARTTLAAIPGFIALFVGAPLRGRRANFYGITKLYRETKVPFREDLIKLFELLRQRRIKPSIAARLDLLEGVRAQQMLEAGGVHGKIVLLAR
jgi:NADPH2:quinone reductase